MVSSCFSFTRGGRALAGAALATSLLSCGDSTAADGPSVSRVDATPSSLALVVDESRSVVARTFTADGAPLTRSLFWSVSDPAVVSVSQAGLVTAIAPGVAQVAASSSGKSAVIPVTVAPRGVALVRIAPATSTFRQGQSSSLAATLFDGTGVLLSGRPVAWTTSSAAVATVNASGVVLGVAPGSATISATAGGVSGTALVTVQAIPVASVVVSPATVSMLQGSSRTLTATTRDSAGRALTGRTIAWSSSAPTIASVSSTGAVTALAPGSASITATSEGRSASSAVTVTLVPVASVTVSPANETIVVGQTAPLVARVADSTGAVLNGRAVNWTTDRASVATVQATTGVVTAVAPGTARITASSGGRSGSAAVTVPVNPVATIQVTPANATLLAGDTQRLTARLLDAQGRVLTGRTVKWVGGAPAVATIDSTGLVTSIAPGSAVVVASSEGILASVPITVVPITVTRVTVTPAAPTVAAGAALQLSASITDAKGRPVAGKVATWTTSAPAIATISATGQVVGVAPGSATLSAISDGVTGRVTLTVTPIKVAYVTVSPASVSLPVGHASVLVVQLADSMGRTLSLTGRTVTWTSTDALVATVTATGRVTGVAPGTVTITAASDGRSGSASVAVSHIPVVSLEVTPPTGALVVGSALQLTAAPRDASGNLIPGRVAQWRSSDAAVASVDASGRVSALAPGTARITATLDGLSAAATITVTP